MERTPRRVHLERGRPPPLCTCCVGVTPVLVKVVEPLDGCRCFVVAGGDSGSEGDCRDAHLKLYCTFPVLEEWAHSDSNLCVVREVLMESELHGLPELHQQLHPLAMKTCACLRLSSLAFTAVWYLKK